MIYYAIYVWDAMKMDFSDKLVFARAALDCTQAEMAKQLDVSYPTINRWENGHVQPTRKAVAKFEQYCKAQGILFPQDESDQHSSKDSKVKYGR